MVILGGKIDANHDFFDVILTNTVRMQGFIFLSEVVITGI